MERISVLRGISRISGYWGFGLIAALVFVVDQISKIWIRSILLPGQSLPPEGIVRLTHVTNTGAAFGLFPNQTVLLVAASAIGVIVIFLYHRSWPAQIPLFRISLGLQLGGALGNLIDRLRLGYVTDFLDLRVWPVFNLADSAIVVGVALLVYFITFAERRKIPRAPSMK